MPPAGSRSALATTSPRANAALDEPAKATSTSAPRWSKRHRLPLAPTTPTCAPSTSRSSAATATTRRSSPLRTRSSSPRTTSCVTTSPTTTSAATTTPAAQTPSAWPDVSSPNSNASGTRSPSRHCPKPHDLLSPSSTVGRPEKRHNPERDFLTKSPPLIHVSSPPHPFAGRGDMVAVGGRDDTPGQVAAATACVAYPSTRRSHLSPSWLSQGDTAWQLTAATLVGLMSVPGLAVLYGGVMQKRWSINSMMLTFATFATVLLVWVLWGFKMGFGSPFHGLSHHGFFGNFIGVPGPVLSHTELQHQATIPLVGSMAFPKSALVYFQLVFAAITPILALGSVLGRVNFKAWIPFVLLWITCVYCVDAFLIWGGGFFAQHGAVDYSGGYVIHLSAGVAGFVTAAVIGPRLQRDREIDAPNNVAMVAVGAGLLWLGWNGFNGGDPYAANMSAGAAILNTNLCTAVAFLVWVAWDYLTGRKPSLIGGVNGMIVGLVAITPAAG